MQIRGWMIDAARLPEPLTYYGRLIDFCARWGFNTILFRLADDQGSAFRFASHPELATHPHAYTAEELSDLAAYAAAQGIDLIPEIESFGHTAYITASQQHRHLQDSDPSGIDQFTGIIPLHPGSLALLEDLYREVAAVFPSPYLHAGCDEVNWGGSEYSRTAIEKRGRAAIWVDHLNALNRLARQSGKELMIWADHVLGGDPAIIDGLDRDVILVNWNYWDSDPSHADGPSPRPGPIEASSRLALEKCFRLVGAPAWGWCRWGVRAGEGQLRNIDAFADIYRAMDDPRCVGVIVTNWAPSRFIQGAIWDGAAYVGMALTEGPAAARQRAFPRFVGEHYGAEWNVTWADVYRTLYNITRPRRACSPAWMAPFQPTAWGSEEELRRSLTEQIALDLPFVRLRKQLEACAAGVRSHLEDFQAFMLAVETLEHVHRRSATVRAAREPGVSPAETQRQIESIAARDAQLVEKLRQDWDRTRFADSPAKTDLLPYLSLEDQTLLNFSRAADYSASLADRPERFLELCLGA